MNPQITRIEDFILALSRRRQECALAEDYAGAEEASIKLAEAQEWLARTELEDLHDRQEKQILALSRAHERELESFKRIRESSLMDEKLRASRLLRELADKHESELLMKRDHIEKESGAFRPSKEVLDMKAIERVLSSEGRFAEAAALKKTVKQRHAEELESFLSRQHHKSHKLIERLVAKQRDEQTALQARLDEDTEKVVILLQLEYDRLVHRYRNLVTELQTQHDIAVAHCQHKIVKKAPNYRLIRIAASAK